MAKFRDGEVVRLKSGNFPITYNFINTRGLASCTFIDENGNVKHENFATESLVPMTAEEVNAYHQNLKNQKSAVSGVTPLDKMVKIATILSPIALVAFTVVNGCNQKQLNQLTDELNTLKKYVSETQKPAAKPK